MNLTWLSSRGAWRIRWHWALWGSNTTMNFFFSQSKTKKGKAGVTYRQLHEYCLQERIVLGDAFKNF